MVSKLAMDDFGGGQGIIGNCVNAFVMHWKGHTCTVVNLIVLFETSE